MANDLSKNPWVVDTASATAILTSWAAVAQIQWIGATTAGHEAIIQDQDGRVLWRRLAQGANQNFETVYAEAGQHGGRGRNVNGLLVPTLGSGILYITFA